MNSDLPSKTVDGQSLSVCACFRLLAYLYLPVFLFASISACTSVYASLHLMHKAHL